MEKATLDFRTYKMWQILKYFAGTFRRAQTLKLGRVNRDRNMAFQLFLSDFHFILTNILLLQDIYVGFGKWKY